MRGNLSTAAAVKEIADTEYANIRCCYPYLDVDPLTRQQELFLLTHMRGLSVKASAAAAGMKYGAAMALLKEDRIDKIRAYFRQQLLEDAQIELNMLNNMALEAHRKSISATEELKAVETLAKLNMVGGFAPQQVIKQRTENEEKEVGPASPKQLESMSEDDLVRMAALDGLDDLAPAREEREPINGECSHVDS